MCPSCSRIAPDRSFWRTAGRTTSSPVRGPCHGERDRDVSILPPTITLFLANLRDEAGDDPAIFRQEVRTTLLHEIGHYLGLDEDGLIARGLE